MNANRKEECHTGVHSFSLSVNLNNKSILSPHIIYLCVIRRLSEIYIVIIVNFDLMRPSSLGSKVDHL